MFATLKELSISKRTRRNHAPSAAFTELLLDRVSGSVWMGAAAGATTSSSNSGGTSRPTTPAARTRVSPIKPRMRCTFPRCRFLRQPKPGANPLTQARYAVQRNGATSAAARSTTNPHCPPLVPIGSAASGTALQAGPSASCRPASTIRLWDETREQVKRALDSTRLKRTRAASSPAS